jgi:hypothetical protein
MSILDTRVYRWLEVATDFFLLNLMWLVACLPVVTIFPSTAAMLIKSRCFCNFLQEASPLFYSSKSMTSLASRSLTPRCSLNSSMSR